MQKIKVKLKFFTFRFVVSYSIKCLKTITINNALRFSVFDKKYTFCFGDNAKSKLFLIQRFYMHNIYLMCF